MTTPPPTEASYFLRETSTGKLRKVFIGGGTSVESDTGLSLPGWKLNTAFSFRGRETLDIFGHNQTDGDIRIFTADSRGVYKDTGSLDIICPPSEWKLHVDHYFGRAFNVVFGHNQRNGRVQVWFLAADGSKVVDSFIIGQIGVEWELHLGFFSNTGRILGVHKISGQLRVYSISSDGTRITPDDAIFGQIGPQWRLQAANMRSESPLLPLSEIFGHYISGEGHGARPGDLRVWYNDQKRAFDGGRSFGNIGIEWELQVASLNGNGFSSDILGQTTDGRIHVWFTNGSGITSERDLTTAPPGWKAYAGGTLVR